MSKQQQQQQRVHPLFALRIVFILGALLLILPVGSPRHAEARPGPTLVPMEKSEEIVSAAMELRPTAEHLEHDEKLSSEDETYDLAVKNIDGAHVDDEEQQLQDDCLDGEVCDRKRLLTAGTDYQTDGPNDPITDPSH